jgi:hypothetical protein
MPRVAEYLGILFYVYADDHAPPHIHAIYGDYEAKLDIVTSSVIVGALPGAKLGQALAWLEQNRAIAIAAWERMNP